MQGAEVVQLGRQMYGGAEGRDTTSGHSAVSLRVVLKDFEPGDGVIRFPCVSNQSRTGWRSGAGLRSWPLRQDQT